MTKKYMILLVLATTLICVLCASCATAKTCYNRAMAENDGCDVYIITD